MASPRSIKDLDLRGKKALIRVDFNVPIKNGAIQDDTRIRASLPTIRYALEHGATVILMSHLGRPKGKPNPEYLAAAGRGALSRRSSAGRSSSRRTASVRQAQAADRQGRSQEAASCCSRICASTPRKRRTTAGSRSSSPRSATSTSTTRSARRTARTPRPKGSSRHVKESAAGLLMADEIAHLGRVLENPDRPFVAILGGAKVSDKLEVIENLIPRVDALLIGGAMAYTFLKARGVAVGKSLVEADLLDTARDVERRAKERGSCGWSCRSITSSRRSSRRARRRRRWTSATSAIGDRMGLDIGPKTDARLIARSSRGAKTVIWNGPMGVFEIDAFANGHDRGRQGGRGRQGHDRHRRRRLDRGRRQGRRQPIGSRTSRPAAARRWSSSAGGACRESRR